MSRFRADLIRTALVAAAALSGCGDDEEASRAAAPTPTPTATAAVSATKAVPADLAGTWKVTLRPSDVRHAPADLRGDTTRWQIEFHATGGKGEGPSMTVENREMGTVVLPISFRGEQMVIEEFVECRLIAYAVEGDRLTFGPTDRVCVRRHTLPAILATRPWRRAA